MVAAASIGNIAADTSSLVACGSLAQKAAKLYTAIDTVAGIANATSNIAAGNASLGDALAFLPILTVGVQKLRGAPTNCFIAGTLVAVAVAGAGVGTADAGPSNASKPIEEIQVGDFVWARAEHDPSAPAVLQKVVALYRNTAHDLQTLDVVGDQGSAGTLGQSVQIVATDEHPFYVVDVGWTTADAVQVGQKLVGAGGAVLTVVANRDWKPEGGVVVYNFQVEGDHTYFVGDIHAQGEWVWTHNMCAAGRPRDNAPQRIGGDDQSPLFRSFNDAQINALRWLSGKGFDSSAAEVSLSKWTKTPYGMRMEGPGGRTGFRIEYDNRNGAHVNVFAGKEKGPHFRFPGNHSDVDAILRVLFG
ncbi:MAG: hypothetical protein EXS06_08720 [Planctomycetaceae bacterium]|nr:hypothetical protein [Planctomycetaceae bacterium]